MAEQRMSALRNFSLSPNGLLSQNLLNEIAAAKICLLSGQSKAEYDAKLSVQLLSNGNRVAGVDLSRGDDAGDTGVAKEPQTIGTGPASFDVHSLIGPLLKPAETAQPARTPIPAPSSAPRLLSATPYAPSRFRQKSQPRTLAKKSAGGEIVKIIVGGAVGIFLAIAIIGFIRRDAPKSKPNASRSAIGRGNSTRPAVRPNVQSPLVSAPPRIDLRQSRAVDTATDPLDGDVGVTVENASTADEEAVDEPAGELLDNGPQPQIAPNDSTSIELASLPVVTLSFESDNNLHRLSLPAEFSGLPSDKFGDAEIEIVGLSGPMQQIQFENDQKRLKPNGRSLTLVVEEASGVKLDLSWTNDQRGHSLQMSPLYQESAQMAFPLSIEELKEQNESLPTSLEEARQQLLIAEKEVSKLQAESGRVENLTPTNNVELRQKRRAAIVLNKQLTTATEKMQALQSNVLEIEQRLSRLPDLDAFVSDFHNNLRVHYRFHPPKN
jgi:hypothetical protein